MHKNNRTYSNLEKEYVFLVVYSSSRFSRPNSIIWFMTLLKLILFFSARDEFYYLPFSDIIKFWERAKAGERKSFTYDEIDKSFRINSGKGIMIHYLETIQKDLDRREQ